MSRKILLDYSSFLGLAVTIFVSQLKNKPYYYKSCFFMFFGPVRITIFQFCSLHKTILFITKKQTLTFSDSFDNSGLN